ncbi:hypothetical protein CGLO_14147 [Colletotrichum gloeosporioides Cg-14]|uniref:Uncharacterized protein n=1 Tax=Colletotrichum gloeosporioides (strain Cg-14) TaxID=1237896 RepID=T0JUX7_COLGC|nr:hypothetical protein CGLO_14147 [Colletotrichum gloeosporioides Cg-14]
MVLLNHRFAAAIFLL